MANAGLSVKERLALLQNNNNNSSGSGGVNNATNKPAGGPIKPAPTVTPKPKPSPSPEAKPGVGGFKPATPSKPAASSPRPGTPPDKPLPANKPAFAAKPGTAAKPFTPTPPPAKPAGAADDVAKTNGSDAALFPKLRSAGTTPPERVTAPVSKQPSASSPSPEAGVATDKPTLTNKAQVTGAPKPEMRERGGSVVTPLKPVSVQERLAALRQNSQSEVETVDPKSKHHHPNSVSPTAKSTTTTPTTSPKPSSAFPPTKPPVLKPVNRDLADASAGPTPELPGIKRSDIAKSLTQAADRVLRSKTTAAAAPAATDGSEADSKARHSHLFQRRSDGKKFRQVDVSSVISSEPAPALPTPLTSVDLKPFLKAYATAKEEKLKADGGKSSGTPGEGNGVDKEEEEEEEDVEELYVEAESTSVTIRGRKGSTKRATSARVSLIAEYTEEEEQRELYTDGSSGPRLPATPSEPEEMYDDCLSAKEETTWQEPLPEEPDEIYEPLDEQLPEDLDTSEPEPTPPPLPSPNTRDRDKENKDKEEAAKRRDKAKEEASKKEEKERKKKEEDLKKMRRKFGLNDSDDKVGDGVVKNNAGGGVFSKDLAVVKGEVIAILRMDGNPAGKWLVQNEQGKLGYVSSNNIEISTPTIRNLMAGVKHDAATSEEPDEMYEPLPDGDMDEIYEEL